MLCLLLVVGFLAQHSYSKRHHSKHRHKTGHSHSSRRHVRRKVDFDDLFLSTDTFAPPQEPTAYFTPSDEFTPSATLKVPWTPSPTPSPSQSALCPPSRPSPDAKVEIQTQTQSEVQTHTTTILPTHRPTVVALETPKAAPTQTPTAAPTQTSTAAPTQTPTATPTQTPTQVPSQTSTVIPTQATPTQSLLPTQKEELSASPVVTESSLTQPKVPTPTLQPVTPVHSIVDSKSPAQSVSPRSPPSLPSDDVPISLPHILHYSPKRASASSSVFITVDYSSSSRSTLDSAFCRLCGSVVPADVITETSIQCQFPATGRPRVCNLSISLDGTHWSRDRAELTLFAGRPFRVLDRFAVISCLIGATIGALFVIFRPPRSKKGVSDAGDDVVPFIPITHFSPGSCGSRRRQ